jgi:hypothetical protein
MLSVRARGIGSFQSDFNECLNQGYDLGTCSGVAISANPQGSTTNWLMIAGIGLGALLLIKMLSR